MALEVLGVPTSAGAYGVGQEEAPRALREAGLLDALTAAGLEVVDAGDTTPERFSPDASNRKAQNLDRVVAVARETAERVADIAARRSVPLVLGGDCTITLGVLTGLIRSGLDPAVAYVDGDTDLSTPTSTRSGILDAMGVAHLLDVDGVADGLAGVGGRRPLLDGSSLALVGFEEAEPDEVATLDQHGVRRFPAEELRTDPIGTADRVLGALGVERQLLVHLDVDAIDSVDCPLAHFPHFNTGASLQTVTRCLERLCSTSALTGLVVTEVDPHHDPDGTELRRLVESLAVVLGGSRGPDSGTAA